MHLLYFLPLEEQFCTAAQVDKIIFAKLLRIKDDLERFLMDIMASVIFHGLCIKLNPGDKYMQLDLKTGPKKCCKRFFKLF